MVLLISLSYPSRSQRGEFTRDAPAAFMDPQARRMEHPNLLSGPDKERWETAIQVICDNLEDESMLHEKTVRRPVRAEHENYQAFRGASWDPKSSPMQMAGLPSMSATMGALMGKGGGGEDDRIIHVHYDRCANCTQPATNLCSKCRIVKYCSRKCQSTHWKKVHKACCIEAKPVTLLEALQWGSLSHEDGYAFHISSDECRAIHAALAKGQDKQEGDNKDLICFFKTYFGLVAQLGGCFAVH